MSAFRILGPIEVVADSRPLAVGGRRQLKLLSLMILHPNRALSTDALIDAVWGSDRSAGALNRLQMAVTRLRRVLGPLDENGTSRVRTVGGGYLLSIRPDELDADVFRAGVRRGRQALGSGDAEGAVSLLNDALGLWRGEPLAEVSFEEFAQPEIRQLEELRILAFEARIEAEMRLRRHGELIGELEGLLAEHPTRESLAAQLMRALYRSGRQHDALAVFQRTRAQLIAELGIEPGPALRSLQSEILEQRPSLEIESAGLERRAGAPATTEAPASVIPSGTVTMLFTDIEGSTALVHELGDGYGELLLLHDRVLREACSRHRGVEVAHLGDGLFIAFTSARAALDSALDAQRALARAKWPGDVEVRVRMGIHTGEPRVYEHTYWGEDVHYAARVGDAAHGGQVLVSAATAALVADADLRELGEFRLKDFPVPRRLLQLGFEDHPPIRTLGPLTSNLPTSRGTLIGRERERRQLIDLLDSTDAPIVTITGAGGAGKTRLALAVAESIAEDLKHGVFFVPLAEIGDPEEVPAAIATRLGIRLPETGDSMQRIAAAVAGRRLVLLLDNFEHLLAAGPGIATLAANGPDLRLLITSQAPLHVRGERVVPLGPLALPTEATAESVADAAASQLLLERARAVAPDLRLTEANAEAIAELCRALDGLPLALELAAARLAAISPADLLTRVSHGIDALGRGSHDLPMRQHGLRAALGWTHELLDEHQAAVLRRMSVFAGAALLERVERVCGAGGVDVLDAVAGLVEMSLVTRTGDGRLRLHATVRSFAWEKLKEAGESREVQHRHAQALAEAATSWGRRFLLDVNEVQAAATAEQADVSAALLWASEEDPECFARLAGGAAMILVLGATIAQWRGLIEQAVERDVQTAEGRTWLHLAASLAALHGADLRLADAHVQSAIAAADESGDVWLACLMRTCSVLNQTMGEPGHELRDQYSDLCSRVRMLHDPEFEAMVRAIEADLLITEGRVLEAEPMLFTLSQARWRTDFIARMAAYEWPECLLAIGEYDRALAACGESLKTARDRAETLIMAYKVDGIAMALCGLERYSDCLAAAGCAETVHKTGGPIISTVRKEMYEEVLDRARAALSPQDASAAYARGAALPLDHAVDLALRLAGELPVDAPVV